MSEKDAFEGTQGELEGIVNHTMPEKCQFVGMIYGTLVSMARAGAKTPFVIDADTGSLVNIEPEDEAILLRHVQIAAQRFAARTNEGRKETADMLSSVTDADCVAGLKALQMINRYPLRFANASFKKFLLSNEEVDALDTCGLREHKVT